MSWWLGGATRSRTHAEAGGRRACVPRRGAGGVGFEAAPQRAPRPLPAAPRRPVGAAAPQPPLPFPLCCDGACLFARIAFVRASVRSRRHRDHIGARGRDALSPPAPPRPRAQAAAALADASWDFRALAFTAGATPLVPGADVRAAARARRPPAGREMARMAGRAGEDVLVFAGISAPQEALVVLCAARCASPRCRAARRKERRAAVAEERRCGRDGALERGRGRSRTLRAARADLPRCVQVVSAAA